MNKAQATLLVLDRRGAVLVPKNRSAELISFLVEKHIPYQVFDVYIPRSIEDLYPDDRIGHARRKNAIQAQEQREI